MSNNIPQSKFVVGQTVITPYGKGVVKFVNGPVVMKSGVIYSYACKMEKSGKTEEFVERELSQFGY